MNISIEPLNADNIADLAALHESVYGWSRPVGHYQTKYATIYPDRPSFGFLAYSKNKTGSRIPVGFYGALPCVVFSGNKKADAVQCADAMTHPDFRRHGLFLRLARLTVKTCRQDGTRLMFGFPNQYSLPGFLEKLGWEKGDCMDCFRLPVKGFRIQYLLRRSGITGSYYKKYGDRVVKNLETVLRPPAKRTVDAGVLRDEEWINQKRRTGMRRLLLEQGGYWVRFGEDLLVGDLELQPVGLKTGLSGLKKVARRLGLSAVQFHCSPGTAIHAALLKEIAPVPSFTIVYKDFGAGISFSDLKFTLADIDTF